MEKITLAGTDLVVSRVCLGTMQFSGSSDASDATWGSCEQAQVDETVRAALDAGISFFDCAEAYGKDRRAERAFGAALRACGAKRDEIVVTSKFGVHAPLWETDSPTGAQTVYDGDAVARALAASLEALQLEFLDLFQIHWPGNVGIVGGEQACRAAGTWDVVVSAVRALDDAKRGGKIRYYGVCNFGTEDLAALAAAAREAGAGPPATNQLPYNPLWRQIEHGIQSASDLPLLCYSPLQQGLLSGKVFAAADVADGRKRTRLYASDAAPLSRHGGPGAESLLFGEAGVLKNLAIIAADAGLSVAELSVAWLLARRGVACVLVGASSPAQARRNARAARAPAAALAKVDAATDALKARLFAAYGGCVDQYAPESRVHGNGAPPRATCAVL